MKVIKTGNFNNIFPMTIKCERTLDHYGFSYGNEKDFCGSELEVLSADIKKHHWEKYPNFSGTDYGVVCPICGKFITIDESKIPEKIMKEADEIRLNSGR